MNYLSLFSGIGGLDLGLDRAGMTCVGQVERDPYCLTVLAHHWPEVPKHDDVRATSQWWGAEPRPAVRLVAGGPPCQGASRAGRRLGAADPRWGWPWLLDVAGCGVSGISGTPQPGWPWAAEPRPTGVAYGVPAGVDRRRALGNAVVSQVGELVGRLILAHADGAERGRLTPA